MSEQLVNEADPSPSARGSRVRRSLPICSATAWRWSRRPRAISTVPAARNPRSSSACAALAYATESMRLTTRLMQLASWLLLHRAVKEGEMSLAQANKEKTKVKLAAGEAGSEDSIKLLPERLRGLIERSKTLQADIRRLDATIHAPPDLAPSQPQQSGGAPARPAQGRVRAGRISEAPRRGSPRSRGRAVRNETYSFLRKPGELLLEARQPAAAVEQLLAARRSRPGATSGRCRGAACRPACPRWCGW